MVVPMLRWRQINVLIACFHALRRGRLSVPCITHYDDLACPQFALHHRNLIADASHDGAKLKRCHTQTTTPHHQVAPIFNVDLATQWRPNDNLRCLDFKISYCSIVHDLVSSEFCYRQRETASAMPTSAMVSGRVAEFLSLKSMASCHLRSSTRLQFA